MNQDEEMESPSLIGRKRSRDDNDNDGNGNDGNGNGSNGDTDAQDAQEKAIVQIKRGKITETETETANDSQQADLNLSNEGPVPAATDVAVAVAGAVEDAPTDIPAKAIYKDLRPMMNDGKHVNGHTTQPDAARIIMTMPHEAKEETTNGYSLPTLPPMASLSLSLTNGTRIEIEMNGTKEIIEQTKECDEDEIVKEEPELDDDDLVNTETHCVEQKTSRMSMSNMQIMVGLSIMFIINTWATFLLLSMYFTPPAAVTMRSRHHPHIIPPSHTHYATRTRRRKAKDNHKESNDKDGYSIHDDRLSSMTLRQFLSHDDGFHLGLAPAFFGFYVYFGVLTAFHEHVLTEEEVSQGKILLPVDMKNKKLQFDSIFVESTFVEESKFDADELGTETAVDIDEDDAINNNNAESKFDADEMGTDTAVDIDEDDAIHNTDAEGTAINAATAQTNKMQEPLLKSVAGASAGAMAAVLLAAGLDPRESAEFASSMTVDKFWDFPGLGGMIKGNLFEDIMVRRIKRSGLSAPEGVEFEELDHDTLDNVKLEDSLIPVAVSGFDIFSLENKIITKGCMGKAARASATFPGLFQPCQWKHDGDNDKFHYLIDGGVMDGYGLAGLGHLRQEEKNKRIVNLVAGTFGFAGPIGPKNLPEGIHAKEVVSISIENAPQCGPWAMKNGPIAVQAAMNAIKDVLDVPMYHGDEEGHYVLHVDVTGFIAN